MTTHRSDVLVIGSSLGGLVAATYLARSGLRVVLVEEDVLAKRPPLLREPFLLSGLEAPSSESDDAERGSVHRVLRELALPLIEQREFKRDRIALQVSFAGTRVDVYPEPRLLAAELDAFELASAERGLAWLDAVAKVASSARTDLWKDPTVPRHRAVARYLPGRPLGPLRIQAPLPDPPEALADFADALVGGLSRLGAGSRPLAPALLLDSARRGVFRAPSAGSPFLELFRRRFLSLHGELRAAAGFQLLSDKHEVGIQFERDKLFARAAVIAAPCEAVRRVTAEAGGEPRWLKPGAPPVHVAQKLYRAEPGSLPVGMASRMVVADGPPERHMRISVDADPSSESVDWLVLSGPGAALADDANPLGELAPFPGAGLVRIDAGPEPTWDLDGESVAFSDPDPTPLGRSKPPIVQVGAEIAPALGIEGEILQARWAALHLAGRLGAAKIGPL